MLAILKQRNRTSRQPDIMKNEQTICNFLYVFCLVSVFETLELLGVLNCEGAQQNRKRLTKHKFVFRYVVSVVFHVYDTCLLLGVLHCEGAEIEQEKT